MTYDSNNNPAPANKLRQFPGQVSTNMWPRLQTIIGADHQFNVSAATNDGWHNVIHMISQSTPLEIDLTPQMYAQTQAGANTYPFVKYPDAAVGSAPPMLVPPIYACGAFAGNNGAAIGVGYNCTCTHVAGTGTYQINFTTKAQDAHYIPLVSIWANTGIGLPNTMYQITDKQQNNFTFKTSLAATPLIIQDVTEVYVSVIYMPGTE